MIKKMGLIMILFVFASNVCAISYKGCESSEIAKQKSFVSNVNISYDYYMDDSPMFSVTLNNITPDMYFVDSARGTTYYYEDTNNGEIVIQGYGSGSSGSYKFYSTKCNNINLGLKYYKMPTYNYYYGDPLCDGLSINICDKWANVNYTREEFEEAIANYKSKEDINDTKDDVDNKTFFDSLMDFYVKYYIYILTAIILICLVIIVIKRRNDKSKFKF